MDISNVENIINNENSTNEDLYGFSIGEAPNLSAIILATGVLVL